MTSKKLIGLIIYSIMAGVCIAFASILYLYGATFMAADSVWERAACVLLFGFGLYFIIVMDYKLFTGMVANLADMKPKEWWQLLVCYLFNTLGIVVIVLLFKCFNNSTSQAVFAKATAVTNGKIANDLFGSFVSAMFCGMMITFAVKSHRRASGKGLSGTLGIIFPVMLFVFMGFEHCIANQTYIFLAIFGGANLDGLRLVAFIILTALGNVVGGVIFPLLEKVVNHNKAE